MKQYFKFVKENDYITYEDNDEFTLYDIIACASILKDIIQYEMNVDDKDATYIKVLKEFEQYQSQKEELLN